MTASEFYKLCLTFWGEEWRPELRKFLERHGLSYTRQSFWNWQHGEHPVSEPVAELLEQEKKRRNPLNEAKK